MRRAAVAAAALALAACGTVREALAPGPQGKPSGRDGWLVYELRDLRFEAPATWRPSGGEARVALEEPDGKARVEVTHRSSDFADERACLQDADERLRQQASAFERSRKHATRFAGHPAQALEGDQGGWHVWAVAVCDGGVQYRVFFTAASPASPQALEAWRTLSESARIGGQA
ncbi:MAG TPA: hypothetical protein VFK90_03425 [Anaeromyxobacter sp.]|nr:hypothetical protein [Anaeromyxobacter sp.]